MLAQWCFTAWYIAMTRPNCTRSLAYTAADSVHSSAIPTASADRITRARSTSVCLAPGRIVAGTPSSAMRAVRRVGSRLRGVVTVTPEPTSTTATSSPTATSNSCASPPPSTEPADPEALPPETVTDPRSATAPVTDPSASPGRNRFCTVSSPAAASTALAITVGTNGPGASARPISSTTTTSSSSP